MNYELAKKLKEAGFPHMRIYFPTLSELISACGENFSLEKEEGENWIAHSLIDPSSNPHKFVDYISKTGPTPEEAVANLWLALNTKE